MKILLAVDGSDYTRRMLSYIADHAKLLGAGNEYTVCTAVSPLPPNAVRHLNRDTVDTYYREQADEVLNPIKAFCEQQGWNIQVVHLVGPAGDVIAGLAESDKHDLIVMGTHGHSALGNIVLGSVTTTVLARCKTPVLLIR